MCTFRASDALKTAHLLCVKDAEAAVPLACHRCGVPHAACHAQDLHARKTTSHAEAFTVLTADLQNTYAAW